MKTPLPNPPPRRRILRKTLFVLATLITLAALAVAEEDWRGARAWQKYKREQEAKGDSFDMARLIPKQVPDNQNFAKTPYLAPLFKLPPEALQGPIKSAPTSQLNGEKLYEAAGHATNLGSYIPVARNLRRKASTWTCPAPSDLLAYAQACDTNFTGDGRILEDRTRAASVVLDHLAPCEATFAELRAGARRPYSQFDIPWAQFANGQVASALMEQLAVLKALYQVLALHAQCELVLDRSDAALDDILVMFRVDDALKQEPVLIAQLVRWAGMTILLQPLAEAVAEHRWSGDQLRVLQEHLPKADLLASTVQSLYGERDICWNPNFDQMRMFPAGWRRLEQVTLNRMLQEAILPRLNLAERTISPSVNHSIDLAWPFPKIPSTFGTSVSAVLHHHIMASMNLPGYSGVPTKLATAQSEVDLATVACALERCRLVQGRYPETLDALVPTFIAVLPHDIINAQPLHYRRTEDGRFVLYSVGWNEKDDGGVVAVKNGDPSHSDPLQGDWVWPFPENP
jgi:hypothetical protein